MGDNNVLAFRDGGKHIVGMELLRPSLTHVPSFVAAQSRGWSASNQPGVHERIRSALDADPAGFLATLEDRSGTGPPWVLPDGTAVPRLPSVTRWMWDEEFCGHITLRWQPGTTDLPPTCLGHIGYTVVPWRRREGIATEALRQMLPVAKDAGLPWVDLTTDTGNIASRRVITANGGQLVRPFEKPPAYGANREALLFRIHLTVADQGEPSR